MGIISKAYAADLITTGAVNALSKALEKCNEVRRLR